MSYERGWQALNLQMPDRIPHTEYVSNPAWVKRLTGLDLDDPAEAAEARVAIVREWDYDLRWFNMAHPAQPRMTHMGTAIWRKDFSVTDNRVCPFQEPEDVLSFDPASAIVLPPHEELVDHFSRTWQKGQEETPDAVVPGGYYNTIFSWCILTFGWDMFLTAAALDEARFDEVLEGFCEVSLRSFRAQAECGCKVFICHDDIVWTQGPVFRPEWYREHVFPRYRRLWQPNKDAGIELLFCSDGDYTVFIDDLADCGADGFIFAPMTDLEYVAGEDGQEKVIIGIVDCRILTFGSEEDIWADVERCAKIGRDCPGYFFAVGNHIPFNVPVESVATYARASVELGRRD